MKFGLAPFRCSKPPESNRSYAQIYQDAISFAKSAEKHGFDGVYAGEHHFWDTGFLPSPLTLCSAFAVATEDIDIGTSLALAPFYDPIRLAEEAAIIHCLSGGRFQLGLGNGYMDQEFEVFGVSKAERAKRTAETIEICKRAWQDEPTTYDGDVFQYEGVRVEPTPPSGGPPILLGGYSEPAVKRAARMADGHLGVIKYPSDFVQDASTARANASYELFLENARYFADAVDLDEFTIGVLQYCHVAETDEQAWEEFLPAFVSVRRQYARMAGGPDAPDWDLRPDNWDLETMSEERIELLRRGAVVGSPETVAARLREYARDTPGELLFIAEMMYPTFSPEQQAESIRLFGTEVIPNVT